MKTPTQEQLNSPDWWREHAPEGATHYSPAGPGSREGWMRGNDKYAEFMPVNGSEWLPNSWVEPDCIPRPHPAKPQAPEWDGSGLPPVGAKIEYDTSFQNWCPAKVIAEGHDHDEDCVVVQTTNRMFIVDSGDRIRPLKTKAESERERVMIAALNVALHPVDDEIHPRQYLIDSLHALYDAGLLRKGGDSK